MYEGLDLHALVELQKADTWYEFRVDATTGGGKTSSEWARARSSEDVPAEVQAPVIAGVTAKTLRVKLVAPLVPNGEIIAYQIFINNKHQTNAKDATVVTLYDLEPYTEYTIHINACTRAGCAPSDAVAAKTAPGNPEGVRRPTGKAVSDTAIALTWPAPLFPNGPIVNYEVAASELYECELEESGADESNDNGCHYLVCSKDQDVCGSRCFDPSISVCCNGVLSRKLGGYVCCDTNYLQGEEGAVCCAGDLVQEQENHVCCGDTYSRADDDDICCDGNLGSGDECCGSTPFTTSGDSPQICCGGKVAADKDNEQCCGGSIASSKAVCCGDAVAGNAFTKDSDKECCGSSYVDEDTSLCCDGKAHTYESKKRKKAAGQVCCAQNVIPSSLDCCNGAGYKPSLETCADRSTTDDSDIDGVCGVGALCPKSRDSTSYCDQCNFDVDNFICAKVSNKARSAQYTGKKVLPNGGLVMSAAAVSTSSGGLLTSECAYTSCTKDENTCGDQCYDGDEQTCCAGVLHDTEDGRRCCGSAYVNGEANDVCCGSKLFAKEADKECCGDSYKVVAAGQVCCGGEVGKGNECCGDKAYVTSAKSPKVCCGGTVFKHESSRQCCGTKMVSSDRKCCGGDVHGVSFLINPFMECCGASYVPSATTLCCSDGANSVGYSYASSGSKLLSNEKCCAINKIPEESSCCNGVAFNPKISVCADFPSDISGDDDGLDGAEGCGGGTICPVGQSKSASCDSCSFNAAKNVCVARKVDQLPEVTYCTEDAETLYDGKEPAATVEDLAPFTPYAFVLTAFTSGGKGESDSTAPIVTLEGPPLGLKLPVLTPLSTTEMLVAWEAPTKPQGVVVTYRVVTDSGEKLIESDKVGNETLGDFAAYEELAVVLEVCTSGGCTKTKAVSGFTDEDAPDGVATPEVTAAEGGREVDMVWDAPATPNGKIIGYIVTVDGAKQSEDPDTALKRQVLGLAPYTKHDFAVLACTSAGCTSSDTVEVTTLQAAPEGLIAPKLFVLGAKRIEATWKEPATPNGIITKYELFRGDKSVYKGKETKYVDEGVVASTSYNYSFVAYTSAGSTVSPLVSANTPEASPEGIAAPTCTPATSTSIGLTWTAPEQSNGRLIAYFVLIDDEEPFKVGLVEEFTATRFGAYTEHAFRIQACTRVGCGISEACTSSTKEATPIGQAAPSLEAVSGFEIKVTWDAPEHPNGVITEYQLEMRAASGKNSQFASIYTGEKKSFAHVNLVPDSAYEYRISASNGAGTVKSDRGRAQTLQAPPKSLGAPTVTKIKATTATFKWSAPEITNGDVESYSLLARVRGAGRRRGRRQEDGYESNGGNYGGNYNGGNDGTTTTAAAGGNYGGNYNGNTEETTTAAAGDNGAYNGNDGGNDETTTTAAAGGNDGDNYNGDNEESTTAAAGDNDAYNGNDGGNDETTTAAAAAGGNDPGDNGGDSYNGDNEEPTTAAASTITGGNAGGIGDDQGPITTATTTAPATTTTATAALTTTQEQTAGGEGNDDGDAEENDDDVEAIVLYTGRDLSVAASGLAPFTTYAVSVVAANAGGDVESKSVVFTTLTAAPTEVAEPKVVQVSARAFSLRWDRPAEPNGVITKYVVEAATFGEERGQVYAGLENEYTVTNLAPFQEYSVILVACTKAGCTSSAARVVETAEAPPEGVNAPVASTVEARAVELTWEAPSQPNGIVTSYTVHRAVGTGNAEMVYSGTATAFQDGDVSPFTEYTYSLAAINAAGSSYIRSKYLFTDGDDSSASSGDGDLDSAEDAAAGKNEASLTVTTMQASPEGVTSPRVTETMPTEANVVWAAPAVANGPTIVYTLMLRESQNDKAESRAVYTGEDTEAGVSGLEPNTAYEIWVVATNAAGSAESPADEHTFFSACGQPPVRQAAASVSEVKKDSALLRWPSTERKEGSSAAPRYTVSAGSKTLYTGPLTSFKVDYTAFDLAIGTTHQVGVQACIENGCSDEYACVSSPEIAWEIAAPAHMQAPHAFVLSDGTIEVQWKSPAGRTAKEAVTYTLFEGDDEVVSGTAVSYLHQGLESDTKYTYRVRATSDNGLDIISPAYSATTSRGAPQGIATPTVESIGSTVLRACWNAPDRPDPTGRSDIVRYQVYVGSHLLDEELPSDTECKFIDSLEPFTPYSVRILACNDLACGTSYATEATTKCDSPAAVTPALVSSDSALSISWTIPSKLQCRKVSYAVEYTDTDVASGDAASSITRVVVRAGLSEAGIPSGDLASETLYSFRVVSLNSVGETAGPWVEHDTSPRRPGEVPAPTVDQIGDTLLVSWIPPSEPNGAIQMYKLSNLAAADDGEGGENVELGDNLHTFVRIQGVAPHTTYKFVVQACNSQGCSSGEVQSFTTEERIVAGLAAPTVSNVKANSFTIEWETPEEPNGVITEYAMQMLSCPVARSGPEVDSDDCKSTETALVPTEAGGRQRRGSFANLISAGVAPGRYYEGKRSRQCLFGGVCFGSR